MYVQMYSNKILHSLGGKASEFESNATASKNRADDAQKKAEEIEVFLLSIDILCLIGVQSAYLSIAGIHRTFTSSPIFKDCDVYSLLISPFLISCHTCWGL